MCMEVIKKGIGIAMETKWSLDESVILKTYNARDEWKLIKNILSDATVMDKSINERKEAHSPFVDTAFVQ